MTAPSNSAGKFRRRDAKKDAFCYAGLAFGAAIGTGDYLQARRELEKAACEFTIAQREVEAPHRPPERKAKE
jgi:hypothetical protein